MRLRLARATLILALLSACTSGRDHEEPVASSGTVQASAPQPVTVQGGAAAAGGSTSGAGGAAPSPQGGGPSRPQPPKELVLPLSRTPESVRLIKTGSIALTVAPGDFGGTVGRVTSLAVGAGGYVSESSTTETGDNPSGTVTVRVPSDRFEAVVNQIRELSATVVSFSVSTQDVSAEFADIDARLRALAATRDRYFELLARAESIQDILTVQDRIDGVQPVIEQLQGRRNVLDDQTTFSTLAVSIAERHDGPELEPEHTVAQGPPRPVGPLGRAWRRSRNGFIGGVAAFVSASGVFLFLLVVAGAIALPGRALWRRTRKVPTPTG